LFIKEPTAISKNNKSMDTQNTQSGKTLDKRYQYQIALMALAPSVLLFLLSFTSGGSSVQIGAQLGDMVGRALIPMLVGLITYTSTRKKDPNDEQLLLEARKKAIVAIVITYVILFLLSLSQR
jgi:hypothetical protein